jgi:hypothetical protein
LHIQYNEFELFSMLFANNSTKHFKRLHKDSCVIATICRVMLVVELDESPNNDYLQAVDFADLGDSGFVSDLRKVKSFLKSVNTIVKF